jgi:hypothetical protein
MTFWGIILLILKFYLAGMLLATLHLVWRMIFRLNRFDWKYCRKEILSTLIFTSVFWPFLLIKVEFLYYPENLFDNWQARQERTFNNLPENPPPCGNTIFFRSKKIAHSEETFGDFTFFAGDIEDYLVSRIEKDPKLAHGETGDILKWIKNRSPQITNPCYIPDAWNFGYLAAGMLGESHGDVFCVKCNIHYPNKALSHFDDISAPYQYYSYLDCPEGHHLIVETALHIINTRDVIL